MPCSFSEAFLMSSTTMFATPV